MSDDTKPKLTAKLTAESAAILLLSSARDWDINHALSGTDSGLTYGYPGEDNTPTPYHVRLFPLERLCTELLEPIDLRGNLQAQLRDRFKSLSSHFWLMAGQMESMPSVPFKLQPQAYVARDAKTGEVISASFNWSSIRKRREAYEAITNEETDTNPEPLKDYPELVEEVRMAMKVIRERRAKYGETNELIEDLIRLDDEGKLIGGGEAPPG